MGGKNQQLQLIQIQKFTCRKGDQDPNYNYDNSYNKKDQQNDNDTNKHS